MADLIHMRNVIQGEVIRIRERRPLGQQPQLLSELIQFLSNEAMSVTVTKQEVMKEIKEAVESGGGSDD